MNEYRRIYTKARKNAEGRGIPFNLTWDEMQELAREANGCCAVSGIPFNFTRLEGLKRRPFGASLDRVDSKQGYTRENCRLVCCAVNFAMNEWGEQTFKYIAQCVAKRSNDTLALPEWEPSTYKRPVSKRDSWLAEARREIKERYGVVGVSKASWAKHFQTGVSPSEAVNRIMREALYG